MLLCRLCKRYLSNSTTKWNECWPCVIAYHLQLTDNIGAEVWKVLPTDIRMWWRELREVDEHEASVVDVTIRLENFHRAVSENRLGSLMRALNSECVRSVRCPFGCWIFIDEAELLSYAHVIQGIDPRFNSCGANFGKYLCRRRADWLQAIQFLRWEIRSSSCRTDSDGLCLLVCKRHSKGIVGEFLHLPQNPISLFPPTEGDTLGVAAAGSHVARFGKPTYSGYTYRMLQATAGFKGVSSFIVKHSGRWDVGGYYKQRHDNLLFHERRDIRELTRQRYKTGDIPVTVMRDLETGPEYSVKRLVKNRDAGLWVPSDQIMRCGVRNTGIRCKISDTVLREVDDMAEEAADDGRQRSTDIILPGEVYQLRSTNRWNEYPKLLQAWGRGCSRITWAIIMVLINENAIWRQVVKTCEDADDNWKTNILWIISEKVLAVRQKTSWSGLQRRLLNHLRHIANVNRLIDTRCRGPDDVGAIPLEVAFSHFFSGITGVHVQHMPGRDQRRWNEVERRVIEGSVMILSTSAVVGSRRRTVMPKTGFIAANGSEWTLRFVFSREKLIIRAGEAVWSINQQWRAAKCERDGISENELRSWNILVYTRTNGVELANAKQAMLAFIGGQATVECAVCERYLVREVHGRSRYCTVDGCQRKMYFSCPTRGCVCGICRKHAKEYFSRAENIIRVRPRSAEIEQNSFDGGQQLNTNSDESNDENPSQWDGIEEQRATEVVCSEIVGGHVIINGLLHCLKRDKYTMSLNTAEQRFLQQIVSRSPETMLTLELPEASLFAGLFFQGTEDNSVEGAIPLSAWSEISSRESAGLASVSDQLLTRLADGSLQTGRNTDYLSYAFGVLFNKRLGHTDSRLIIRRGYYSLTRGATAVDRDECPLPLEELDSRQQVRRLAASLKADSECTKLFVTLTCNQRKHFGIAPLRKAITEYISNLPQSEQAAVQEGTMVDICLAWSRVLKYFVQYISSSTELLGPVGAVFARVEFQVS